MTYTVQLVVQPEPVLLARITVLLRKYDIQVRKVERQIITNTTQEIIRLDLEPQRDNFAVAMKKLERLVPVISLQQWSAN